MIVNMFIILINKKEIRKYYRMNSLKQTNNIEIAKFKEVIMYGKSLV